jgi:hypothetical protein
MRAMSPRRLLALSLLLTLAACPDPRRNGPDDDDNADDDDATPDDDDATGDDDDATGDDDTVGDDDTSEQDPCDAAITRLTNIGCEFWAADLDNAENFIDNAAAGQFAVVVANVHDTLSAHVEVRINDAPQGSTPIETLIDEADVPAGGLHIFRLPRRDVDGEEVTPNVDDGTQTWLSSRAFRINSDAPIVAYQFNTLDQQFSNDASLLLPTHALGTDHTIVAWPPNSPIEGFGSPMNRCYVTVLGVAEETVVHVTPSSDIKDGAGVPPVQPGIGILAGTEATFTIGPYDVLNLETTLITNPFTFPPPVIPDVTGSVVVSEGPVAVFTGCDLAMVVPEADQSSGDSCCAEHLEKQVPPTRAMRNRYVVSRSAIRNEADPEVDVYRIMAINANTQVTTNLGGAEASFTLNAGEFHEFESDRGFVVDATQPVHVVQFLVIGTSAGYIGDSSMLYVPAAEQRRADYTLTTGEGFSENWLVLSIADGTTLYVDGQQVTSTWCEGPAVEGSLDGTDYVAWQCPIQDGAHRVASAVDPLLATEPFGVSVYGYYSAGSYAYPGGAGLE